MIGRLLIDECLSPELAQLALNALGDLPDLINQDLKSMKTKMD